MPSPSDQLTDLTAATAARAIASAAGAGVYRNRVPTTDATVARKLRDAGTVLLGKLNTHELAFGTTTTNPPTSPQPTGTPHGPQRRRFELR